MTRLPCPSTFVRLLCSSSLVAAVLVGGIACADDDPVPDAVVTWTSSCAMGCREQFSRSIDGVNGENGIQLRCSATRGAGGTKILSLTARNNTGMPEFGLRIDGATWNTTGVQAGGPSCAVALTEQFQTYGPGICNGGTPCRVTITQESAGSVDGSLNVSGTVSCEEMPGPDPSAPFRGVANGSFQVNDCEF